jgi:DMSO/TMAO reductase YedYZ molybdopterin-dependent catalytic subunit
MTLQRRYITEAPENSETPLAALRSWVTPNRLFFVRNHWGVPEIDIAAWRLTIGGCVQRPIEWAYDDLAALPERTVFATVECAGNGRSFLQQHAHGVQWGAGAVGHAEWSGVPLCEVLEQAGLRPEAIEVLFEGADRGSEADHPEPMQFARSLPRAKALDPDTLLALRMNGEPLEAIHGAPVRLLVPGWYGVASVKWLRRIEVLDRTFAGYFQSTKYTVRRDTPDGPQPVIVGPMALKSEIIRPAAGEALGLGGNRIFGVAWAGEDDVQQVEVSVEGGRSWQQAELVGPQTRYSWTMWEYLWEASAPGEYELLARATSSRGAVQPLEHSPLNGGYQIHHSRPTLVQVDAARRSQARRSDWAALVYDMNAFAEENYRRPLDVALEFSAGAGI